MVRGTGPSGFGSALLLLAAGISTVLGQSSVCDTTADASAYGYKFKALDGNKDISLGDYKGKVIMIMNVATY